MRKGPLIFIALVALWWFKPFASERLTSDVPHKLIYKEQVFGASSGDRLPMLIVLHGAGADEKDPLSLIEKVDATFRYIGFRGPESAGSGYTWARASGKSRTEADEAYGRALNDVAFSISKGVEELTDRYPTSGKPVLLGFSMGAELTYFLAGAYPGNFSAFFPVAGRLNPGLEEFFVEGEGSPIFAYHGKGDRRVRFSGGKKAVEILAALGRDVTLEEFDGGHIVPHLVLDDIAEFFNQ